MGKAAGFTLVEVLVTTAITSVVILSLMGAFRTAQVAQYRHGCAIDRMQSLRSAATRITEDARAASDAATSPDGKHLDLTMSSDQTVTYRLYASHLTRTVAGTLYKWEAELDTGHSFVDTSPGRDSLHLVLAPTTDARCGTNPLGPDSTLDLHIALYSKPVS